MSCREWKKKKLKHLTLKIGSGATPRGGSKSYKLSGIPFIRSQNIYNCKFKINGLAYIDLEQAEKLANVEIYKDDILLNITGNSVARCTKVPNLYIGGRVNQHVAIIRVNKLVLDSDYLKYQLVNDKMQRYLLSIARSGGTRAALTKEMIENLEINLSPLKEQKAIAHILSTLDEKIEVNNQINKTLEEMAQAIFKHWFVDFEFPCLPEDYCPQGEVNRNELEKVCTYNRVGGLPVPDGKSWFIYVLLCEDGSFYKDITNDLYKRFYEHYIGEGKEHKPTKVIHYEKFNTQEEARRRGEELKTEYGKEWLEREYKKLREGLPDHQTCLMTAGEMVESEIGMIPKGWEVKTLEQLTSKFTTGLNPRKNFVLGNGTNYYVTIKNMSDQTIILDERCDKVDNEAIEIINKRSDLKKGDILFSGIGTIGRTYLIDETPKNWNISESIFTLRAINEKLSEFLYFLMLSQDLQCYCKQLASGSVQKGIRMCDLKRYKIAISIKLAKDSFRDTILPIIKTYKINQKENQKLKNIRDTLLPKLMSGEIRVPLDLGGEVS